MCVLSGGATKTPAEFRRTDATVLLSFTTELFHRLVRMRTNLDRSFQILKLYLHFLCHTPKLLSQLSFVIIFSSNIARFCLPNVLL